jgi:GT2 family glycosyltransferase/glycosyltransferase involved in cell wall biosynthesis/SAM-dependent methyltransferase
VPLPSRRDAGSGAAGEAPRGNDGELFTEQNSVAFHLVADEIARTYVVDLRPIAAWREGAISSLRFDPLDRPGRFEVLRVALLSEEPPVAGELRRRLGGRFLRGNGIEIGALQNPTPLPPGAHARYVDRPPLAQARAHYPELAGRQLIEPNVLSEADALAALESESQDFVVCNHVLEHMKDPIGALVEWLRVLRSGGHLYVSIPVPGKPLDRHRAVTDFGHLVLDHEQRGSRAAEDAHHYHEWVRSVNHELSEAEQSRRAEELRRQEYSIHFHVFDVPLFRQVLARACAVADARLAELIAGGDEQIAVLRKGRRGEVHDGTRPGVDIVIPVYNARELTRRCIESVLRHASGDWRLILVDDASTEAGLPEDLERFARRDPRVILLRNEANEGFVKTANRGMRQALGRDVLLLNSDTEVYAGFLERLVACAHADITTGVASPFSNNATICSVPEMGKENPIPEGHTPASWAELIAACSQRRRPDLVTAVGFCMYVKAEVFERIGYFDEISYGRGFGEENDFCERAKKAGFRIRLCDDVFVYHKGKASFGDEGRQLESNNASILEARQPGYHAAVAEFFRTNPLAPLHEEIRLHLRRSRPDAGSAILFLVHLSPFAAHPGGTEFHVRDLLRSLALPRAVIGYPDGAALIAAEVLQGQIDSPILYRFPLSEAPDMFCLDHREVSTVVRRWVDLFSLGGAHIHHLMNWPIMVGRTLRKAGVDYCATLHDFYSVCPNWNLVDRGSMQRCECRPGGPGCLESLFHRLGATPPADLGLFRTRHREAFLEFTAGARSLVFPSEAGREVTGRYLRLDKDRTVVIPHGSDAVLTTARPPPGKRIKVAVLGEVASQIKGAAGYLQLVRRAKDLDVEWHFFGTTPAFGFEDQLHLHARHDRLVLHGRYARDEIVNLLAQHGIDVCVIMPAVDESFSYVLTEAVAAGVPVIVNRRGALPERVNQGGFGWVVEDVPGAYACLAELCRDRTKLESVAQRARAFRHPTLLEHAHQLRQLYGSLGFLQPSPPSRPDPEVLAELSARWQRVPVQRASAQEPRPRYQGSSWYPYFLRVKRLIPQRLRNMGRGILVRAESPVLLRVDPWRRGAVNRVNELKLVRRGLRVGRYRAEGNDPHIILETPPFPAAKVRRVRFRIRHELRKPSFAQLFWVHSDDEQFREAKSARVAVQPGGWNECSLDVHSPELSPFWQNGEQIVRLRFDPLDVPGSFEMGPIELLP